MQRRKLDRLRREGEKLRGSSQKAEALQQYAQRLGRKVVNRGKHPMWESKEFPNLRALSIPDHGAKDIPRYTKNSILNQLDDDILAWDERITSEETRNDD